MISCKATRCPDLVSLASVCLSEISVPLLSLVGPIDGAVYLAMARNIAGVRDCCYKGFPMYLFVLHSNAQTEYVQSLYIA